MNNELSNKKILEQISICTDLLILSIQESAKTYSVATCLQAKDLLCSIYNSPLQKSVTRNTNTQKQPAIQRSQPLVQTPPVQSPVIQAPVAQAPILQQKPVLPKKSIPQKIESKNQTPRPKEVISQKTIQETISPLPEASSSTVLDIERSPLFKLLPRKVSIDSNPPLDLKAHAVRFTPRSRPLPQIREKEGSVIFGVTPQVIESTVLGSFIENVKKAVNEQLARSVQAISVLTPLGFAELMAASIEKTSIFLFINTSEKEILLKLLKKIPAFKEESTQNTTTLSHQFSPIGYLNDSSLFHVPLEARTLQDLTFKRSLWNALKSQTIKS